MRDGGGIRRNLEQRRDSRGGGGERDRILGFLDESDLVFKIQISDDSSSATARGSIRCLLHYDSLYQLDVERHVGED